ncbi:MAG TPA: diacylglycerol kinase family protein [Leptospiraceae bacterium]|nr:diacylglycerol kinase family protein [Leptospiraceae bacterium]HMW05153.1 diacylglycerol kinase family protein [Leptospiraceae bacterium]HMX32586.1 diacylglycerol kinase family protein [Leptospiraceae bacterium]HMY32492.1 diacylglycerol kinase family protein [Leptospiraceae bacterium]HMZ66959.1 diacylglycerol kinase family protein [Leptospiraceae bacterium]
MKKISAVLVFNPKSGKGKARERAIDFSEKWKEFTGTDLKLRPTASLADIRVAANETYSDGTIQIFMGGDGTLSESIQGISEKLNFKGLVQPVGFLPGGTGNSFLRDFDIKDYKTARDRLLQSIDKNSTHSIDSAIITYKRVKSDLSVGEETKRIMFNIWGVGLISDITKLAIRMRKIGSLNYTLASLIKLLSHRPYELKTIIDGIEEKLHCNMITVSNSQYTGGKMQIAPHVRVNDGQLFLISPMLKSRIKLFQNFPKIFKGEHVNHPEIKTEFIKNLEIHHDMPLIMNVDGELEEGYNPKMQIHPSYFKIYMIE